jgi:hypothetical protein
MLDHAAHLGVYGIGLQIPVDRGTPSMTDKKYYRKPWRSPLDILRRCTAHWQPRCSMLLRCVELF